MARGRVRNRMELREQAEAAEAREKEQRTEEEDDSDAGEAEPADVDVEDAGEEVVKPAKKKKKKAATTEPRPKRSRTAKPTRQRLLWVVFDNSHKQIQAFDSAHRQEAEELAARLTPEKKATCFVQPVKEDVKE